MVDYNKVLLSVLWFLNGSYFYFDFSLSIERSVLLNFIMFELDIVFEDFGFGDIICFI